MHTESPQVRLANEIAAQFHHLPPKEAAAAIAAHIRQFWDPRMRADLDHHAATAPETLDPLALEAAHLLTPTPQPSSSPSPTVPTVNPAVPGGPTKP
ncbi:formate dehydrogenase subunit delta [Amycolatopsis alkalitolerans]|uniref:Formate dehydrogenase n=1 Tax=Amycolatopsis alkalitolerans TaxID=2547244 RepID=A0A5C4M3U8_9PSEU|nr:formate dehydrogenase subunit delta [Amycolatopsis alkalitolerans]TNC26553.1 hypothetical protein FG385_12445 [Amycolatopsis alkalitolerans]